MAVSQQQYMEKWLGRFVDLKNEIKKNIIPIAPASLKRKLKKIMKDFHDKVSNNTITQDNMYSEYFAMMAEICKLLAQETLNSEWIDKKIAAEALVDLADKFKYDIEPVWNGSPLEISFDYVNSRDEKSRRTIDLSNIKIQGGTLLLGGFDGESFKAFKINNVISDIEFENNSYTPDNFLNKLDIDVETLPVQTTWRNTEQTISLDETNNISLF